MACDHFYKGFVSSHMVTEWKTNLALKLWLCALQQDAPFSTQEAEKCILGGKFYRRVLWVRSGDLNSKPFSSMLL